MIDYRRSGLQIGKKNRLQSARSASPLQGDKSVMRLYRTQGQRFYGNEGSLPVTVLEFHCMADLSCILITLYLTLIPKIIAPVSPSNF